MVYHSFLPFMTNSRALSKIIMLNCLSSVWQTWIIKAQKDVLSHESKKNIVYKINCKSCNASYVGQTSREIKD